MDEIEIKAVDLHEGIDNTLMILQNRLKASFDRSQIQIIKSYCELPLVECYAGQLNQVFMNLLSNAIDALEEQNSEEQKTEASPNSTPTINIHTEVLSTDRVLISIADNGAGISETTQQRLFDPFFTTKPVGKETGLEDVLKGS